MSDTQTRLINVFAPAKINLYLHVTGRLESGYHTLDSLVAFADIGDHITIQPADELSFDITGPYARAFSKMAHDTSRASENLVIRAIHGLSEMMGEKPNVKIKLHKNLPLSSGIGGGSSDAAATLWGLLELWEIPSASPSLQGMMSRLGADVPVCFACQPKRIRGIGDVLDSVPHLPEIPIVLVNPLKQCATAEVFAFFSGAYKEPIPLPEDLGTYNSLISFLKEHENDLHKAACQIVPEIDNISNTLSSQKGCGLARLSGSGATCFGLFEDEAHAKMAVQNIRQDNPDWWVKTGWLNRPERY